MDYSQSIHLNDDFEADETCLLRRAKAGWIYCTNMYSLHIWSSYFKSQNQMI